MSTPRRKSPATKELEDGRRAALVDLLDVDPEFAAPRLAALGDPRVVPDLSRAVDRLLAEPIDDCAICTGIHLSALTSAIEALGGRLTAEQQAGLGAQRERAASLWIPFGDGGTLISRTSHPLPARRPPRPGRDSPCPCGSGRRYGVCHLDAGEGATRLH